MENAMTRGSGNWPDENLAPRDAGLKRERTLPPAAAQR